MNLLEALEAWTKALDEGLGVDVLFLDYRTIIIASDRGDLTLSIIKLLNVRSSI